MNSGQRNTCTVFVRKVMGIGLFHTISNLNLYTFTHCLTDMFHDDIQATHEISRL
jgi:hypothetical protein